MQWYVDSPSPLTRLAVLVPQPCLEDPLWIWQRIKRLRLSSVGQFPLVTHHDWLISEQQVSNIQWFHVHNILCVHADEQQWLCPCGLYMHACILWATFLTFWPISPNTPTVPGGPGGPYMWKHKCMTDNQSRKPSIRLKSSHLINKKIGNLWLILLVDEPAADNICTVWIWMQGLCHQLSFLITDVLLWILHSPDNVCLRLPWIHNGDDISPFCCLKCKDFLATSPQKVNRTTQRCIVYQ